MTPAKTLRIGVLALQGAFSEHIHVLARFPGVVALEIRTPAQLADLDGLVLPGGESTTIALLAEQSNLLEPLQAFIQSGKAVWGTCAGLILLAHSIEGSKEGGQQLFGGLDITVLRNAFGGQRESFVAPLHLEDFREPFDGVFIRAPIIQSVGERVQIIAKVDYNGEQRIVAVKQGNILGTSFHPELTDDNRIHCYFVKMVAESVSAS